MSGTVRREFNRPRICPACGELAYPADPKTICRKMYRGATKKMAYFCDAECVARYDAICDGQDVDPLYGEMLDEGAQMMMDDEHEG